MRFTLAERVTCAIRWMAKSRLFLAALPLFEKDISSQRKIERRFLHTSEKKGMGKDSGNTRTVSTVRACPQALIVTNSTLQNICS